MNTDIVAKILADALRACPEFAHVPVWEPMDEEKQGDTSLLVNVTGADELIPGNYTFKFSGEIMYRQRYAETTPEDLFLSVTEFGSALRAVQRALLGRQNSPEDAAAWVVLHGGFGPALADTSATYMVYKSIYELFIQF